LHSNFFCDFLDAMMVVKVTGEKLMLALENGVSKYPAKEG
jgi:hypothetical protein